MRTERTGRGVREHIAHKKLRKPNCPTLEVGRREVNTTMSITPENHATAQNFMNIMNGLMEIVESMAKHAPEGEYLAAMDMFLKLYQLRPRENGNAPVEIRTVIRTVVMENPIVRDNNRRVAMKIRASRALTDAQKIKSGRWITCKNCDRLIVKGGMKEHLGMEVCKRTKDTKKISKTTQQDDTTEVFKAVALINGALRKVGRTGADWIVGNPRRDTGYWLKGTYDERAAAENAPNAWELNDTHGQGEEDDTGVGNIFANHLN